MTRSASDLAAFALAACAVILTSIALRREFLHNPPAAPVARKVFPGPPLTLVGREIGSSEAPVAIVEFADFQCPYCARAQVIIRDILARYPGRVKLLYRHLPLEALHPYAWSAALAAECAGDQGRFAAYHDLLYQLQDSIGRIGWTEFARRAGVPVVTELEACMEEERHTHAVERDVALARSLQLRGTPAIIVGDELVEGVPPARWISRRVARELRKRAGEAAPGHYK